MPVKPPHPAGPPHRLPVALKQAHKPGAGHRPDDKPGWKLEDLAEPIPQLGGVDGAEQHNDGQAHGQNPHHDGSSQPQRIIGHVCEGNREIFPALGPAIQRHGNTRHRCYQHNRQATAEQHPVAHPQNWGADDRARERNQGGHQVDTHQQRGRKHQERNDPGNRVNSLKIHAHPRKRFWSWLGCGRPWHGEITHRG